MPFMILHPRRLVSFVILLTLFGCFRLAAQDQPTSPNLMTAGGMSGFFEEPNPWGGVDSDGNLRGLLADQIAVDDSGNIRGQNLSPSVAFGDLNGDGLLDLVLADPKGFFWFYPNSGTKTQPKFATCEIMPIWLGSPTLTEEENNALPSKDLNGWVVDHLVPRIQLIDFEGGGKFDLVVGTYPGKLFYIRNTGTASRPGFDIPKNLAQLKPVPTRSDGLLDSNYFSPYLYDWTGNGHLDLLRGDGTYSANSIFLYTNMGTNDQPVYNEQNRVRLISGQGREHLVPLVIDWNNDGKPDIIAGEREGYIDLFLNVGQDRAHPAFDQGQHLKFGGRDKFGQFTTVTSAPLSGNPQVPDVVITNDSGEIFYCHNTGTPGKPNFSSEPQPIKGTNPYPKILVSNNWALGSWNAFATYPLRGWSEGAPHGVPYELLTITNASKESSFKPPLGETWKNALKFLVVDHKGAFFPVTFYPPTTDDADKHSIAYTENTSMDSEAQYQLSFWVKGEGIHDVSYKYRGGQYADPNDSNSPLNWITIGNPVSVSPTWNKVSDTISWNTTNGKRHDTTGFWFNFDFYGQGTLYIADVQLHKL